MPPLSIMIKPVSSACNMRCRYCFYADVAASREKASMGRMSESTLETLVRRALRYAEGSVTFAFQGGEPTLAGAGFFKKLIELEKTYNSKGLAIYNSIQSNGYDISEELMELFAREHFLVGISLDGVAETHDALRIDALGQGSYARVRDTVKRLEAHGVEFNILCVVNSLVAKRAGEVFEALSPYGYVQFIPCLDDFDGVKRPWSLTVEDYTEFLKKSFDAYYASWKKGRFVSVRNFDNYLGILLGRPPENCAMSGRCAQYYLIEADGGVYPCDFYVLDQLKMGNVNENSFFTLEKSPVAAAFRAQSMKKDEKCTVCRWFSLCRGGCRRDREPYIGENCGRSKWCECYEEFFPYALERMQEMAQAMAKGQLVPRPGK